MSLTTYAQALDYWFRRVNFEQRTPEPSDLKLDRMRGLLALLGEPQRRLRIVHVAGSKGKGSTSAMLAAIVGQAGYRTGLFTSPHLCQVEERIQVDGQPIRQMELIALLEEIRQAEVRLPPCPSAPLPCTFFEIATALGFLHFVRRRVELALVEVGLGGRFDSTNVCQPLVAVLTSISFDHTKQLGNRLASIAMEKAGIVKPRRPTISGVTTAEPREVIERICGERGSPLRQLGVDFHYRYDPGQATATRDRHPRVEVHTEHRGWPSLELSLWGAHQAANAAVTVACVEHLRKLGLHLPDSAVAAGLAKVPWPARLEIVQRRPFVVLDCAHNVASAQAVVDTLNASFPPARRLLVFASSSDKDLPGMFEVLGPHFAHAFLTRYTTNTRAVPPEQLAEALRTKSSMPYTLAHMPADAWQAALAMAAPDDVICVTGSVFLAGELRPLIMAG